MPFTKNFLHATRSLTVAGSLLLTAVSGALGTGAGGDLARFYFFAFVRGINTESAAHGPFSDTSVSNTLSFGSHLYTSVRKYP